MSALQGKLLFFLITALTCNSFLLIGFDNGVLGGVINQPAFNATFNSPDATTLGLIVSLYEGKERKGVAQENRGTFFAYEFFFSGMFSTSYGLPQMIIARIVSGIGMGFINSTAPVYQSEFSPRASRGLYACAQLSTLNFGIFLTYWIDYGFAGIPDSYAWRVPVVLQCIFIIPIIVLSGILPDTPRWLIGHSRIIEAEEVYSRVQRGRMPAQEIESTFNKMKMLVAAEDEVQVKGFKAVFRNDHLHSRRRLLIACSIQFFQQLGGINGIIYYAGTIFSTSLGFDDHFAALMSGFLFTWFFVASFIPWFLIDRIGRRPLLLYSITLMAAVFAVLSGLVSQIQYQTSIQYACGAAATAMLFIYQGAFTVGFQATVWVYPPEILPLRIRQTGTAIATACNWIINFMVVQITPVGIANIGWKYYIIYAIFNACFVPIIYFFYPETKGLELEDVDRLFAGDSIDQVVAEKGDWDHGLKSKETELVQ
ncbi:MAG: hypothetical protein GOMPHAMPRED_000597 [Gomphillus americanus]|uniref:Major facilitator superfamily (MFS) profile domain-containing protein n=1 Tax=Gomphillus americanus TaxID=1940652 RepID=A0A8H3EBN0_9LECA|nr:MAG: hypothetical protein GOMPHAMPRED_000597 [Gomphillus americanus]